MVETRNDGSPTPSEGAPTTTASHGSPVEAAISLTESPSVTMEIGPGAVIGGKYQIERLLGEGGMGVVYLAHHVVLSRLVAVKVMKADVASQKHYSDRFIVEARAAAELRHRNVVEILDYGVEAGRPFMVMEFLHGESLEKLLAREGPLSPIRAVTLLDPVLKALAVAHEHGIVHRDIKPDNIFLAKDEGDTEPTVKVVDFGIARRVIDEKAKITGDNTTLGTPLYMAPEQILSAHAATAAADQYAFGVTLYQCLTGRFPVEHESLAGIVAQKITGRARPILEYLPDLDAELAATVMRTLEREPTDRFPSMNALREALSRFMNPASYASMTHARALIEQSPTELASPVSESIREAKTAVSGKALIVAQREAATERGAASASVENEAGVAVPPSRAEQRSKPRSWAWIAGAGVLALIGIIAWRATRAPTASAPQRTEHTQSSQQANHSASTRRVTFSIRVVPAAAVIVLEGEQVGVGTAEVLRVADGRRYQLELRAPGYQSRTEVLTADSDVRIERALEQIAPVNHEPDARATGTRATGVRERDAGVREYVRPVDTRHPVIDRSNPFAR